MGVLKQNIKTLEAKYKGRIERAESLLDAKEISDSQAEEIVYEQFQALKEMSKEDLIKEFCEFEELLIRGVLGRL